jgi:hypothetical protein
LDQVTLFLEILHKAVIIQVLEILLLHFLDKKQQARQIVYLVVGNHKHNLAYLVHSPYKPNQRVIRRLQLLLELQKQVSLVEWDHKPTIQTQAKLKMQICKVRETNPWVVFLLNLRQVCQHNLRLQIKQVPSSHNQIHHQHLILGNLHYLVDQ